MGIIEKILGKKKKEKPVIRKGVIPAEALKEIPARIQVEVGPLKAKLDKANQEITRMQKERKDIIQRIEETSLERAMAIEKIAPKSESLLAILNAAEGGNIILFSREGYRIGRLDDIFWWRIHPDKTIFEIRGFVPHRSGKKRATIMMGDRLEDMIHQPLSMIDVLKTGHLVLNRYYDNKPAYNFEIGERDTEEVVAETMSKKGVFDAMTADAKEDIKKETEEKDMEDIQRLGHERRSRALEEKNERMKRGLEGLSQKQHEIISGIGREELKANTIDEQTQTMEIMLSDLHDELAETTTEDAIDRAVDNMDKIIKAVEGKRGVKKDVSKKK